ATLSVKHLHHMVHLLFPPPQHREQPVLGGNGQTDHPAAVKRPIPSPDEESHVLPFPLLERRPIGMTQKEGDNHQIEMHFPRSEQTEKQQAERKNQASLESPVEAAAIGKDVAEKALQHPASVQGIDRKQIEAGQHGVPLDEKGGPLLRPEAEKIKEKTRQNHHHVVEGAGEGDENLLPGRSRPPFIRAGNAAEGKQLKGGDPPPVAPGGGEMSQFMDDHQHEQCDDFDKTAGEHRPQNGNPKKKVNADADPLPGKATQAGSRPPDRRTDRSPSGQNTTGTFPTARRSKRWSVLFSPNRLPAPGSCPAIRTRSPFPLDGGQSPSFP